MNLNLFPRNIGILGSTGSIGTQALEVVRNYPGKFNINVLTANNNAELLISQALEFQPEHVVIANKDKYQQVKNALKKEFVSVHSGEDAISDVVQINELDVVLTALVGYAGLRPTIKALEKGKHIALANKETLVVAGELIKKLADKYNCEIYPVDSEHSAIFQCMIGEEEENIEKIYLTASGGPFRGKKREQLENVSIQEALNHPNWNMGSKITIDSATLMNKGLEVIEAKWLFDLHEDQVEVVVHPQSVIHSMVQFKDSSIKAQLGIPDMRIPIQYALSHPLRLESDVPRFNFKNYPMFTFEEPDFDTFKNLKLAFEALKKSGIVPCVLNAANEIAVEGFLNNKIGFLAMSDLIEHCMNEITYIAHPNYEDYVSADRETRIIAKEYLNRWKD
ncbi:MAG: 1-deoxy-D-xylulose-5-phosphate reductoisomerase [Cytophagales bacterium]